MNHITNCDVQQNYLRRVQVLQELQMMQSNQNYDWIENYN